MKRYKVKQHIPNFVSGYTPETIDDVEFSQLEKIEWIEKFKDSNFIEFKIKPYFGDVQTFWDYRNK